MVKYRKGLGHKLDRKEKRRLDQRERFQLPDSPFEPGAVFVPSELRIENGKLLWTMDNPAFRVPRGSVLDKFRRLHRESDEYIYDFASGFGVAWFCQHHLPGSHGQIIFGRQHGFDSCFPVGSSGEAGMRSGLQEELMDYRIYSRAADAIVKAAGLVNANQVPSDGVVRNFAFRKPRPIVAKGIAKKHLLEGARNQIGNEINEWIAVSQGRPELVWDRRRKSWVQKLRHSPWGVLGAVAFALLTTVPQSPGWLICSICGESYETKRPSVPGRNHYCTNCRNTKEMWRRLKQQQRAHEWKPRWRLAVPRSLLWLSGSESTCLDRCAGGGAVRSRFWVDWTRAT